jgi:hypothetical protein
MESRKTYCLYSAYAGIQHGKCMANGVTDWVGRQSQSVQIYTQWAYTVCGSTLLSVVAFVLGIL